MQVEGSSHGGASHRHEADVLSGASQASDLSYLASRASLFMKMRLAKPDAKEALSVLSESTTTLLRVLRDIASGQELPDRELSYRQLVPVRVWRQATPSIPQVVDLVDQLTRALEEKLPDNEMRRAAEDLERVARVLREQSAQALAAISA